MSILVVGGAGFIGYHLCKTLVQDNESVICIDNLYSGQEKHINELLQYSRSLGAYPEGSAGYDAKVADDLIIKIRGKLEALNQKAEAEKVAAETEAKTFTLSFGSVKHSRRIVWEIIEPDAAPKACSTLDPRNK